MLRYKHGKIIYRTRARDVRKQNPDTTSESFKTPRSCGRQEETIRDKKKEKEFRESLHSKPQTTPFRPVPVFLTARTG